MRRTQALAFVALTVAAITSPTVVRAYAIPVNIESTPPGATVYVDATTSPPIGTTPLRSARIERGNHTLIFRLEGHEEGRLPVNVSRRRETFRIVLNALGTLVVTAGNSAANAASVRVDGQAVGNVPFRNTIQPGRHLIQVGKEDHVTFTQWIEVAGGQVLTLPVLLEREAPQTGSLLVAGDVSGAPIYLDGDPRGVTPTLIENIPAGEHRVEIRAEGQQPWSQTIRVVAGERLSVNPQIRPTRTAGSLRILANVPGATILLDGEELGQAPVTREDVSAGQHILEARASGYQNLTQPVTVEANERQVVNLQLQGDAHSVGRIIVDANIGNATVIVDNEERGSPPVVIETPPTGTHAVVVRADGYEDFRTTCETGMGRSCEIDAMLRPEGTPVRIATNARGSVLYIDGNEIGPIPYEGPIPIGPHRLEVRADGYETHVEQINLVASSETRDFDIAMIPEGELSEEERADAAREAARARAGATSHSGGALPPDVTVFDLSIGWPHLAELRLNVGIFDWLEGGFAMRTFFRLTEFEGRVKIGARPVNQVSVGAQVRLGGGIGPSRDVTGDERMDPAAPTSLDSHTVNDLFFIVEGIGTLHFSDQGAFNLWLGVDVYSDQYDWAGPDSDVVVVSEVPGYVDPALQACVDDPTGADCNPDLLPYTDNAMLGRDGRQGTVRLRLGGSLDLVVSRNWNVWGSLEGILAGDPRDILGDIYGFDNEDTELYVRLGLTHKF